MMKRTVKPDEQQQRGSQSLRRQIRAVSNPPARGKQEEEGPLPGENEFADFIEGAAFSLYCLGPEGNILLANQVLLDFLGFAREEFVGHNIADFLVDSAVANEMLQRFARNPSLRSFEAKLRAKDGSIKLVLIDSQLRREDNRFVHAWCFLRDITVQRQIEEELRASEERYRDLVENAIDIIYTLDLEGNFRSLNKAAEQVAGYTREEALQMNVSTIVAPEYLELAQRMLDRKLLGENLTTYELEVIAKDGHRVPLEISTRLIRQEGKPVGVQGIARNITERKRAEAALHQANVELGSWVNELEQRTREMTLLNEMGDLLRACVTIQEAYAAIAQVARQLFSEDSGALCVIGERHNLIEAVALWGETAPGESVFTPEGCWSLRRGRVHRVDDTRSGLICKHLSQPLPAAYICVPMMALGETLGILHLSLSQADHLTEAKQRLVVTVAEHIALALSNLKLHETLRNQSIIDPLTGLFNRRFMEESLEREVRRAERNQHLLGVIMLDLDNFKNFNDTFGHDAGDSVLRELGGFLQAKVRGGDIACRYGGEEFTLILPEGDLEAIRQRAEHLRLAIKHLKVRYHNQPLRGITVSLGVAIFPKHGRLGEELLRAADEALYRAKNDGRDRVAIAD